MDIENGANLELASACAGVGKADCEPAGDHRSSHAAINHVSDDSIEYNLEAGTRAAFDPSLPLSIPRELAHLSS